MEKEDVLDIYERCIKSIFQVQLKDEQLQIIHSAVCGKNAVGFLPTGFGKSLCYILPPLILDELDWSKKHISLVVTPLKSLMKDQVEFLREKGIAAASIEANMSPMVIQGVSNMQYSVIFTSPEAILTPFWKRILLKEEFRKQLCVLACDEAHCISEWGDDFRPEYRNIGVLRSITDAPVIALSGTCTEKIKMDIFQTLALHESETDIIARIPDRPNIFLHIERSKENSDELNWISQYLIGKKSDARKIIVYCRSINTVAELYLKMSEQLEAGGISQCVPSSRILEMYHRGLDHGSIQRIQEEFRKSNSHIRCLLSTIAFGLGIQINDISCVVHWGVPKTILGYWQEVGRAGRDPKKQAVAICYAYSRSLSTSDLGMKEMMSSSGCFRNSILEHLSVKEMPKCPTKISCANDCDTICECNYCKCCTVCKEICSCPMKSNREVLQFFQH